MPKKHILKRLEGIQKMLIGAHHAGGEMSSATKGHEREQFINLFLSQVFPPTFRFASGDATDKDGNRSGQLDIVIEFPFLPSLPIIGVNSSRLYMAEGIASVLEIKSDIKKEWNKVQKTANRLSIIRRDKNAYLHGINPPGERIPFFAIGYEGWKTEGPLRQRLRDGIDGILVINNGLFISSEFNGSLKKAWSLWGLIFHLYKALSPMFFTSIDAIKENYKLTAES